MNFLKRIAKSAYINTHLRWPSATTLRIYWSIVALVGLGTTITGSVDVYHHAIKTGQAHPGLNVLIVSLSNLLIFALMGLIILYVLGLYYRIGTEMLAAFRSSLARAPIAWQSISRGAAAMVIFLRRFPSLAGSFFRALGRAFLWLAGRPAWWRNLARKQKVGVIFSFAMACVYAATLILFYPVAHHISAASPSWMFMSDAPLSQTLSIDMFLGTLIATFAVAIIATVIDAAKRLFSNN